MQIEFAFAWIPARMVANCPNAADERRFRPPQHYPGWLGNKWITAVIDCDQYRIRLGSINLGLWR